ncbi:MAG: hypothetical protein HOD63_15095 [Bacteroidetes bacterium]|nr:hypothetical protein [Bacteroidota bacterium]MBT4339915.1 hypothetical protein [Bacteroidota bacterium]MBT4967438.1 hypothetical protein [Bacteroidota bacterium]MBT5992347.1 hypothetical protein [Bacteroidota bacterium]
MKIQKGQQASVILADYSPDGKKLATLGGYGDGLLILWDIETTRELLNKKISEQNFNSACQAGIFFRISIRNNKK